MILSTPQIASTLEGKGYDVVPGNRIRPASQVTPGREVRGHADMPGQWEATLSRGQVEIMVQEERKQEVKRAISAEGHVFREAVNRKRSHARSWEERVLSGKEQTRVGHGVPGERQRVLMGQSLCTRCAHWDLPWGGGVGLRTLC